MLITLEKKLTTLTNFVIPTVTMNNDEKEITYDFTVTAQYVITETEEEGQTGDAVQPDSQTAQ